MKVKWICPKCRMVVVSDSKEHHKLDMCDCGKSGVDLEDYMCRVLGLAVIIESPEGVPVKKEPVPELSKIAFAEGKSSNLGIYEEDVDFEEELKEMRKKKKAEEKPVKKTKKKDL